MSQMLERAMESRCVVGQTGKCRNGSIDKGAQQSAQNISLLLYGGYACGAVGFSSVLFLGQSLANEHRSRTIPVVLVFVSLMSIRMARALVAPIARGITMSWQASSVFVSAVMTMVATYLPSLRERVFELVCSFTVDVVAKWLMMIVIAKSKCLRKSGSWASWRLAKQIYESAMLDLCVDGGGDAYVASLFGDHDMLQDLLYVLYVLRALKNLFLAFSACKEIGEFDNQNAANAQSADEQSASG